MKNNIFLLLISFHCIQSFAQTELIPGEIKGKHDTFIVSRLNTPWDTVKYIGIDNKRNKYNKGIPYSEAQKDRRFLPMNPKKDIHVNNDAVKQIVYSVLSSKQHILKQNKEKMNLTFIFEPNGKLTDIGFTLHENTAINIQDIEEIDKQLRASIKVTFTGSKYLKYIAINYYMPPIVF